MNSGARAIDSPQNARAKIWLALTEARGIRKHGAFLLSGRKTVPEALAAHGARFTAALARTESELNRLSLPAHIERYVLAKPLFEALDTNGTGFPLLVGEVPDFEAADFTAAPKGLELVLALGQGPALPLLLLAAAFLFSSAGDLFLAMKGDSRNFMRGLAAFLVSHLFYIAVMAPIATGPDTLALKAVSLAVGLSALAVYW